MSGLKRVLIVTCVVAGLAGPARADVVVLTTGARVSGEVKVGPESVTIRSQDGILTLPSWRVAQVLGEGEAVAPPAPAPEPTKTPRPVAEAVEPAAEPQPIAAPVARPKGPPAVAEVLARKLTVSFEGVPVPEVLEYIRELTGVNMALAPEVRAAQVPVYINVKEVPLSTILELVLEPNGLSSAVRPGQILYVGPRGAVGLQMRVYRVTDLLLSVEDKFGGTAGTAAGGGIQGRGGLGQGLGGGLTQRSELAPQYQPGAQSSRLQTGGGAFGGSSALSMRAENLILLIKSVCGQGTWAEPYSSGLIDSAGGGIPAGVGVAPILVAP